MRSTGVILRRLGGIVLILAAVSPALAGAIHVPLWTQGMTWTVEQEPTPVPNTRFNPLAGNPLDEKVDPVRSIWEFTVDRVAETPGMKLYSILVRAREGTSQTSADLVFAGEVDANGNQTALYLLKGTYRYPTKGGISEIRRDYNEMSSGPFPVLNDVTAIPCDFPFLEQREIETGDASDGFWKEYTFEKRLFGDVYLHRVRQTLLLATQKIRRPDTYRVVLDRKENQDYYLRLEPGEVVSRLVFNPKYPWPVFGESPKGRFWLLPN